jgi:PKD repeat protein
MKNLLLFLLFFPICLPAQLIDFGMPVSTFHDCKPAQDLYDNEMPNFELTILLKEDSINNFYKIGPWRFGNNFEVNFTLDNSGDWFVLPNGDRIWRLRISSKDALSINLIFEEYFVPKGAHIITYNISKTHFVGAYTSLLNNPDEIIGSELVNGEDIIVEYFEPYDVFGQGRLRVGTVTHAYKKLQLYGEFILNGLNDSGDCNQDVACPLGIGWENQINAVALIVLGGNGVCTGALINNTNNDGTPYFLTADHCLGSNTANWLFRFNWNATNPSCGTTAQSGNSAFNQTTFNGVLRASNAGSDFALLELNNSVPTSWNPYYAGWDRTDISPPNTTGIHHPRGDLKKICRDNDAASKSNFSGAVCWEVSNWNIGVTEPGSSGSPLFDQNKRIIGQLYGGSAACSGTVDNGQPDFYGRLAISWVGTSSSSRLRDWLDPSNSNLAILDGYNPNTSAVALDAQISSITQPTTADICGSIFTPIVVLRNSGTSSLTSCQILYQVTGGSLETFSWTGNLATSATLNVTLTALNAVSGANTFTVYTESPNGSADQNPGNDSKSVIFDAIVGGALPLAQNFQVNTFPPPNYSLFNGDNDLTWARTTTAGANSSASMFLDNWDYDAEGAYDWFILPSVDLSNASNASITYDYAYAYYDGNQGIFYDSMAVAYSNDCGDSWNALSFEGGIQLATAGGQSTEFTPGANDWENVTVDLNIPALVGQGNVLIAFVSVNGYGNNLYVDNINIQTTTTSTTPPIAAFFASTTNVCTGTQVTFSNSSTNSPTSYTWSFPGGNPSTSTQTNPVVSYANSGNYTVSLVATNAVGSDSEVKTNYISVSAGLNLSITSTPAPCSGINTGTAAVNASGGAGNYTYSWTGSNSSSATAVGLAPGNYTVTVSDAVGCSSSTSINVVSNVNVNVQLSVTDSSAQNGSSSIQSIVSGGSLPYTYSWNAGATSSDLLLLSTGTYTLTVTDANGCNGTATAAIGGVSIRNPEWLSFVSLYPNPTNGQLNLDLTLQAKKDIQLQVFNALGQVMYAKTISNFISGIETIDLREASKGVYSIQISDDANTKVLRFIKN